MKENIKKMELEKGGSPEKKEIEELKIEEIVIPDINILVYLKQL
jgi:hypothetical protein